MNTIDDKSLRQQEHDEAFEAFAEVKPRKSRLRSFRLALANTAKKAKPKEGFAKVIHIFFVTVLPLVLYVLVRLGFVQMAVILVLLSKWRMFSVKFRHWPAHIRTNAVDIIVGVSTVLLMAAASSQSIQFAWVLFYIVWLLIVKPQSSVLWIGLQAMIGQGMGLMALYTVYGEKPLVVLVAGTSMISYFAARHFFTAFDETLGGTTAYVWAYFTGSLTWLLAHWLIYYGVIAQPVLIISVIGYTLAGLYYLQHNDRLSKSAQRQFIVLLAAILLFLIVFSDWGDKSF